MPSRNAQLTVAAPGAHAAPHRSACAGQGGWLGAIWRRIAGFSVSASGRESTRAFERRLFWTTLLIAVSLMPPLGEALRSLHAASDAQRRLNATFVRTLSLAQDLRSEKSLQDSLVPVFILTGDVAILERLDRSRSAFGATIAALHATRLSQSQAARIDSVVALQTKLVSEEAPGFALRRADRPIPEIDAYFREHVVVLVRSLTDGIAGLLKDARQAYEVRESANEAALHSAFYVLAASLFLAVGAMLFAARILFRTVLKKRAADADRERAAERMKAVAAARKEAVEACAHDLRNPLTAILLLSEQMGTLPFLTANARSARMLDGIANSAESMRLLISNLLDHAKIESGTLALSLVREDVVPLLRILVARYEVLAARRGVRVVDALPASLPAISYDTVRLEQIFANLLGNAVKFTPDGGVVTLSGAPDADRVVFAVSDSGTGMDADEVTRIFERYWQANETASWGTGLGLAITKAVVDAHGGTIAVESRRGVGSTFTVALPSAAL